MPGFVRVSGYNQTDMDNNYQSGYNDGVTYADGRANPSSVNYQTGYNAGITYADGRANPSSVNYQTGYNAGIEYADGRANPDSVNYQSGKSAGEALIVTGTAPVFVQSGAGENDYVDLYIYNNTGKTMRVAFFVKLEGNDRSFIINGEELWPIWYSSYRDLPTGANVHLYQKSKQTADERPGQIGMCVIGAYNNIQDTREHPDSSGVGTITFT